MRKKRSERSQLAQGHTAGKWQHQDGADFVTRVCILSDHTLQLMLPPLPPDLWQTEPLNNRSMLRFNDKSHRRIPHSNKLTSSNFKWERIRLWCGPAFQSKFLTLKGLFRQEHIPSPGRSFCFISCYSHPNNRRKEWTRLRSHGIQKFLMFLSTERC